MIHKIDLENPQWCNVWDDDPQESFKKIFVAELSNGRCVACTQDGISASWNHYELITKQKPQPLSEADLEKRFLENKTLRFKTPDGKLGVIGAWNGTMVFVDFMHDASGGYEYEGVMDFVFVDGDPFSRVG